MRVATNVITNFIYEHELDVYLDSEMSDVVKIAKVDVDENPETAGNFGVMSIPTLILLKDGEIVDKAVGFQPKEALAELVKKHA